MSLYQNSVNPVIETGNSFGVNGPSPVQSAAINSITASPTASTNGANPIHGILVLIFVAAGILIFAHLTLSASGDIATSF